ncbi:MAG: propionyl-CoA synthetase [Pseudomonadales bacterium]
MLVKREVADMNDYRTEYMKAAQDPQSYWAEKAKLVDWYQPPQTILANDDNDYPRWFVDGQINTSYLCLDYHVAQGRGEQTALIYDSPVTGSGKSYSYRELHAEVAQTAGALRDLGVVKGDRVVIYMPMVPEAAVAMLACARLGAVHSIVFGGFAPKELAVRIEDATPDVILTASCGIEIDRVISYKPLVDAAIELSSHKPSYVAVLQRPQCEAALEATRDLDWKSWVAAASPADPVPLLATDPLYILYTSGTTGKPKGVLRDNGSHAVAMRHSMQMLYGAEPGDVYWAASDVGWVVGHSYIVYAPLITGCTTILYEGKPVKTPDAGAFWRVCAEHKVKVLFTAPTAFRAMRKEDPEAELLQHYDISHLERIYLAGERLDPPTYEWLHEKTGLPIIDHWWQTETGWAITGNPIGIEDMPVKSGSSTVPMPGYNVQILDAHGKPLPVGEQGSVAIKLPLPPGTLATIWGDHERFKNGYLKTYPGYYLSGDGGYIDEDGYLFIMGRSDDVINVAGHRLSTGEMEEILGAHSAVAECAVIGIADALKGQIPLGLVVLKMGQTIDDLQLEKELIAMVREQIGAVASFRNAMVVERLPKTRSGKILRKTMRQLADGEEFSVPSTIDDPAILDEIGTALSNYRNATNP